MRKAFVPRRAPQGPAQFQHLTIEMIRLWYSNICLFQTQPFELSMCMFHEFFLYLSRCRVRAITKDLFLNSPEL